MILFPPLFRSTLTLLTGAICAAGQISSPFPSGFSMSTLGAVMDTRGAAGRQSWIGAAFLDDTAGFGFALCGISYYGAMDEDGTRGIYQASGGFWYAASGLVAKASFTSFNAWSIYFEEQGFLSIGTSALRFLGLSAEITGTRMRYSGADDPYAFAEAGVSAWLPWSWAGISFSCEHLTLKKAGPEGSDRPLTLRTGIHTVRNRFGSQGALVTVIPDDPRPVCFSIGEEYRITPAVAFHAALANNPVLIAAGMAFSLGTSDLGFALVNHPVLGWSQGVAADYGWR